MKGFSRWINNMTFRKPLWLLCREPTEKRTTEEARAKLGHNDTVTVWGDAGPEQTEVHKFGCVLKTESTGLRKRMRERKSSGQSDLLWWERWREPRWWGKEKSKHHCWIEAGLVYFFRRDGALRIKVIVSSDAVYHCHLLMQTKDKHFGGNSLSFQTNSIHWNHLK